MAREHRRGGRLTGEAGRAARRSRRSRGRGRCGWRLVGVLLVGLLGLGLGLAAPIVLRGPLVVGQDAVSTPATVAARVSIEDIAGRVLHVAPDGPARAHLILYPGGLVRPQAYEWLGRALAARGVETWIPEMPLDLAVLGTNRADAILDRLPAGVPVVLAGHSLGSAMAADYASRHPDRLAGLLLMAAYPADNVRVAASWPALSLAAEYDGRATLDRVRDGLGRLPGASRVVVVPGAVHAFFGRYGPQAGDGIPTVSRADAEAAILAEIVAYLDAIAR